MRETRVDGKFRHRPAVRCKPSHIVHRAELCEEGDGLLQVWCRKGIKEPESGTLRCSPAGEVKGKRCEIRGEDLRDRISFAAFFFGLRPESVAQSGRLSPCTSTALVSRCYGCRHGHKSGHSASRVEPRDACESAVDHHTDPVYRQTRLGDTGRADDLPDPASSRQKCCILVCT